MKNTVQHLTRRTAHGITTTITRRARQRINDTNEQGMATTEYAIVMVAAAAFAGVLVVLLKSDTVKSLLTSIVEGALSVVG